MNANKIRSGLICAVIVSFAGAAIAKNADGDEGGRADKHQKQEQRQEHITRQGVHREQQHANNQRANNPPPRQEPPPALTPRHSPPASVPSRPPVSNPPRGGYANNGNNNHGGGNSNSGNNNGGHYNNGGNHDNNSGGYYAGGRNPHFVPPPRYNNSNGNGHAPRYNYPPGRGYSPRYAYSPAYGHYHGQVRPPHYVTSLPAGYHRHYWNGNPYYYHSGNWYRPYGARYVVASPPYGLFVPYLPVYSSLWFGSTRYYYSEGVYYNYEPVRRGYVVARSPYVENNFSNDAEDLYFYPAQGQGEQQQTDDRYECHRWAVDETQYDPVDSDYDAERRSDYDRAITACMTGRGYTVS